MRKPGCSGRLERAHNKHLFIEHTYDPSSWREGGRMEGGRTFCGIVGGYNKMGLQTCNYNFTGVPCCLWVATPIAGMSYDVYDATTIDSFMF